MSHKPMHKCHWVNNDRCREKGKTPRTRKLRGNLVTDTLGEQLSRWQQHE